jgi:hypothetical protein
MIIFVDDPRLIESIHDRLYHLYKDKIVTLNLGTPYKCHFDISNLVLAAGNLLPRNGDMVDLSYMDNEQFDIAYSTLIFNDIYLFHSFMRIMAYEYTDLLVFIFTGNDIFRDAVVEAIIKIIQQRYGKNAWKVSAIEDIEYINIEETFTPYGIQALDDDIKRINELAFNGLVDPIMDLNLGMETPYGRKD